MTLRSTADRDVVAPMVSGPSRPESMRAAVGLSILALAGYGCALRLIDVRPYAVFQHYQPWAWLLAGSSIAVWGVLAQALVVAVVAWRLRAYLGSAVAGVLSRPGLLVAGALFAFSLAVPAVSVPFFAGEVILAAALALVAALNLVLVVLLVPDTLIARAVKWVDARVTLRPGAGEPRRWDRRLPLVVGLWVVLLSAATSVAVLERVPHIDDSISNYFQARYFARGDLYLPAPPDTRSFQVDQTVVEPTKWYGYAFPVWPAVLAIGVLLGVPWLVNPVLGGVLIVVGHALVRRRTDRATANVAVLMLAASPWLIFMSAEFMAQPVTGVLVLLAALAFDYASERGPHWPRWAVLAGLTTGTLVLTRAIEAALAVAAIGITVLADRRFVRALPATIAAGVLAAGIAALILPYNQAVTGRATYPPHMAWSDGRWGPGVDRLGFGPDIGIRAWPNLDPLPGHGAPDVVLNANKNAFMTNIDLFGWAPGSLVFVWLALALGRWRGGDTLLLAICATFIVGYSAYWFSGGPDLGARYWYPMMVPLAAMTARGAQMLTARLQERGTVSQPGARIGALLLVATVCAAVVMVPWRAVTKHYRYRGISGEVRDLAASHHFEHALVFVRSESDREYPSAFNFNPATLDDAATIYARDAGAEHRAVVVAHFANRPVWVIGRRQNDAGGAPPLEVLEGPLAPGTNPK